MRREEPALPLHRLQPRGGHAERYISEQPELGKEETVRQRDEEDLGEERAAQGGYVVHDP